MESKTYKIARVLQPVGGQSRFLCVSEDGDCWSIRRNTDLFTHGSDGEIIKVPLIKRSAGKHGHWLYAPHWPAVGWTAHRVQCLPFIHALVLKVWGDRAATDYWQTERPEETKPNVGMVVSEGYFTTSSQMSATAKAHAARRICEFAASGFRRDLYDTSLRQLMCQLFSMNHAENERFFDRWFTTTRTKIAFLRRIVKMTPVGDPSLSLVDVRRFTRNWLLLHVWQRWVATERRSDAVEERATLLVLLKKHGVPPQFRLPTS